MDVSRHDGIESDLKKLQRFANPVGSLEAWERLFLVKGLSQTPGWKVFGGFGERKIYKARVVPMNENVGKSHGYRLVFEMCSAEICKILVFSRHGIYHDEPDLINLVKEHLRYGND